MYKEIIITYKESLIYSLGNLANKFVGFVLMPLYTHFIPIAEYGVLGLIEPLVQFSVTSLSLGINAALLRWYSIAKSDEDKKKIFFNANLIIITNTFIIVIILIIFSDNFSLLLFHNLRNSLVIKIAFANIFFLVANPIIFSTLRIEGRAIYYSSVRIAQFSLNLLLNIVFVVYLNYGILSIFLGQLISSSLVFLYFIPFYISHSKISIQVNLMKSFLKFGVPLIFVGIAQLLIVMFNRYILDYYENIEAVGLFSFAYKLSNTIRVVVVESLALSLSPILYRKLAEKNGKRFVQQNFKYTTFIVLFIYILFASFSKEFIYLFAQNKDYYNAYLLIPILSAVYIFNVINYFHYILLGYAKKTSFTAIVTIITAVVSIILNFLLIPKWGICGAGIAIVLSSAFMTIVFQRVVQNLYGHYLDYKKILTLILIGTMIIFVNFNFFMELSAINFIIKFIVCISFPIFLYYTGFYEIVEILKIKEIFLRFFKKKRR